MSDVIQPVIHRAIQTAAAPAPVGAYPHARRVGQLLFLSGIGPRSPGSNAIPGNVYGAGGQRVGYDIAQQCHAVFANVRAVLEASGAQWRDLIDVTVYLTNMAEDFKTYNAVWAEYFPEPASAPCRTTLGITALPTPIAIELKCIAALPAAVPDAALPPASMQSPAAVPDAALPPASMQSPETR